MKAGLLEFVLLSTLPGFSIQAADYLPVIPPPGSPPEAFSAARGWAPSGPAEGLGRDALGTSYALPQVKPASYLSRELSGERPTESSWYARIDYFHWNERLDGQDFVNEDGPLVTLGYVRRVGPERFRAELFGGTVGYQGGAQGWEGETEPLNSHTNYLGLRGEYDLVYDPEWWPAASLFVGIGTRFWFRDLPDDYTESGMLVWGYQETWWTIYPYVGLEKRRTWDEGFEFYVSGRIGTTAITYQHVTWDDVVLYPRMGLTGQIELGIRSPHLLLTCFFEGWTWGESAVVRDSLQPMSRQVTVGLRAGFSF